MQNLVLPLSLAIRAASRTESTVTIFEAFRPVWYREDWAHWRWISQFSICMHTLFRLEMVSR